MKPIKIQEGRNNAMPRCMHKFFGDLESLSEVETLESRRLIHRNTVNEFEANIQFYDETRRTFRVKVGHRGHVSYFNIRVSPDAKDKVGGYIKNYIYQFNMVNGQKKINQNKIQLEHERQDLIEKINQLKKNSCDANDLFIICGGNYFKQKYEDKIEEYKRLLTEIDKDRKSKGY